MTTKIVTIFKYITITSLLIISTISCETNFENVGGDLVDNGVFDTKKANFNVLAYTKNIESSRVDNLNTNSSISLKVPLGVMDNEDFGVFKSSVISQVGLPVNLEWEDDAILDAVYLEIPYDATDKRGELDDKPKFELNNIISGQDSSPSYQIKISRLETYLNRLSPLDPSQINKYYSDKVYDTREQLALISEFKPNENDTIGFYDRTYLIEPSTIQANDTIKLSNALPFIKIPLDKSFFQTNFINNPNQSLFENNDDFQEFFRGIVIEAIGNDGSVMMLDFSLAKINMYFSSITTNNVSYTEIQLNADINEDGAIGKLNINDENDHLDTVKYPVRSQKIISFPLTGIQTNYYDREYTNTNANGFTQITNPNIVDGEQKLYVQGAAGSIAVIDLFNGVDLTEIRAKNWLINEANLTLYVDDQNYNSLPSRLLLYKLDSDDTDDVNGDAQILDAMTSADYFNGFLQKDKDRYIINITDYISEVLKKEDFITPPKLGLKVYNELVDTPKTVQDTIVEKYSWNPQSVVLFGNSFNEADADFDKKLKLEIYYTELNN